MNRLLCSCLYRNAFLKKTKKTSFQFDIPPLSTQQQPFKTSSISLTRPQMKMSGLRKISQEERQDKIAMMNKQQLKRFQQILEYNSKTATFNQVEYAQGQSLLQDVPVDPYYSYKVSDLDRKIERNMNVLKDFLAPEYDYKKRGQNIREVADEYHEKLRKFEAEEFERYLDDYPGSIKGPRPEDDLQNYIQYGLKKLPKHLVAQQKAKSLSEDAFEDDYQSPKHQTTFLDYLSQNQNMQEPVEQDNQKQKQKHRKGMSTMALQRYNQISDFPQSKFLNFYYFFRDYCSWKDFKNYFNLKNLQKQVQKAMERIQRPEKENNPTTDFVEIKPSAPSLCRYYRSLPKFIQENQALKTVYLGLQYKSPDFSYEEKEQGLNYAASLCLPYDKVTQDIFPEAIKQARVYLTPFLVDKVFSINPEFTWDMGDFLEQLKQEELRGQNTLKQKTSSFPQPPPKHLEWEQGAPKLPVDYYDNDDGFWDQIISQKLKRYDTAKPMLKFRKYLKH